MQVWYVRRHGRQQSVNSVDSNPPEEQASASSRTKDRPKEQPRRRVANMRLTLSDPRNHTAALQRWQLLSRWRPQNTLLHLANWKETLYPGRSTKFSQAIEGYVLLH